MKETALNTTRPAALRTAPDWIVKRIEQRQEQERKARKRKANMKACTLDVQHKLRELELAEATL